MTPHVPEETQAQSRFDPEYHVWVTPTGATWQYIQPGAALGRPEFIERGPGDREAVLIPVYIFDQEHIPFERCLTREQAQRLFDAEAYQ